MNKGVSIILCTYNGKSRLDATFKHIAKQLLSIPCELILVDNASTDGTKEFADIWWEKNGVSTIEYRSFIQLISGKSFAQELGYAEAKYEYLLVCDDDNWLCDTYVQTAFDIMDSNKQIGAAGGWCEAEFEGEKPEWFNQFARFFAVSKQGDRSGDITFKKGCLYGAGMVHRKSVWEELLKLGFEQQLSCRKGNSLSSGGDTEHSYAIKLLGYKLWYDERLYFKHFMSQGRLSLDYISRLRKAMAYSNFVLTPYLDLFLKVKHTKSSLFRSVLRQLMHQGKRNIYFYFFGNFEEKENAKAFLRMIYYRLFRYDIYKKSMDSILKWKPNEENYI